MGIFSKIFDDVLGLDPNGGGIYNTARNVLGDTIADDWLGMDPNGGGAVKAWNVALPALLGYGIYNGLGGLGSSGSSASAGSSLLGGLGTGELTAGYDLSGFLGDMIGSEAAAPELVSSISGPGLRASTMLGGAQPAASTAAQTIASGASKAASAPSSWWDTGSSWLQNLMKGDKTTLNQAQLGLGALGMLGSLLQSRKPRNAISPAALQALLKSPYSSWTQQQQQQFNDYFYQPVPQLQYQPPQGLARGGRPHQRGCGCEMCNGGPVRFAEGGALSNFVHSGDSLLMDADAHVRGYDPGQSDVVHARLSPGEYVLDADVVSALGDGNNDAGAQRLDEMREAIRRHKRGAKPSSIPPKARSPLEYLKET